MAILVLGTLIGTASGAPPISKEYKLKAAFLYHFAKFVEWPANRFANADSPIVIGVLRENPFGDELTLTVEGRKINNRRIVVMVIRSAADVAKAHLVFVGAAHDARLGRFKEALQGSAVLSVGETPEFERQGGMITFVLQDDSLRFRVNKDAAQKVGLKISAQLQKLAAQPGGGDP